MTTFVAQFYGGDHNTANPWGYRRDTQIGGDLSTPAGYNAFCTYLIGVAASIKAKWPNGPWRMCLDSPYGRAEPLGTCFRELIARVHAPGEFWRFLAFAQLCRDLLDMGFSLMLYTGMVFTAEMDSSNVAVSRYSLPSQNELDDDVFAFCRVLGIREVAFDYSTMDAVNGNASPKYLVTHVPHPHMGVYAEGIAMLPQVPRVAGQNGLAIESDQRDLSFPLRQCCTPDQWRKFRAETILPAGWISVFAHGMTQGEIDEARGNGFDVWLVNQQQVDEAAA